MASVFAVADGETFLPDVEVKSLRDANALRRESATPVYVVGATELERFNEATVGDLLRKLPGLTFSGPPGRVEDIRMLGMDKGYTQILIDGDAIAGTGKERQWQVDRLAVDLIERIEIVRSPNASMSSEGIGGVINIVLRDDARGPKRGLTLIVDSVEHSDVGGRLGGYLAGREGPFQYRLGLDAGRRYEPKTKTKATRSFSTAAATLGSVTKHEIEREDEMNAVDSVLLTPSFSYESGGDRLQIGTLYSRIRDDKDKTLDKFAYATPATGSGLAGNGSSLENEIKTRETWKLSADYTRKITDGTLHLRAYRQGGGEDKGKDKLEYNKAGALSKTTREDAWQDELETKLALDAQRAYGSHLASAGIEWLDKRRHDSKLTRENGSLKASGLDAYDLQEQRYALWLQDEWALADAHTLTGGLRWLHVETSARQIDTPEADTRIALPSAHYRWALDERNILRASVARSIRLAKFEDLNPLLVSSTGTSSSPDKTGNPALRPERAWGSELGFEHHLAERIGMLGFSVFHRDISDLVEKRTLQGSDGRYVQTPFNVGNAEVWGWQSDANVEMGRFGVKGLTLFGSYSRYGSSVVDSASGAKKRVKDQPRYSANLGFDWKLPAKWQLGLNYNYQPSIEKAGDNGDETQSAQKLLDLSISKQLGKHSKLRFSASNLLDADKYKYKPSYSNGVLSGLTEEEERGARSYMLTAEVNW